MIKGFILQGLMVPVIVFLIATAVMAQEADEGIVAGSEINQTLNQTSVQPEKSRAELNAECALKYECRPVREYYWYGCFFDRELGDCRCYVGEFGQCRLAKSSVNVSVEEKEEKRESEPPTGAAVAAPETKGRLGIILTIVLVALLFIVSRALDRDNARNNFARARRYHRIAEDHHLRGNEKKARHYYEQAEKFRKKAEEQL